MARERWWMDVERKLNTLPAKVAKKVTNNALRAGARVIRDGAKRRVPKVTHELEESIKVATVKGQVKVGFEPPTSRRAHLTEYGTEHSAAKPFMRPTIDEDGPKAIDAIGKVMGRGIEREAKKGGSS